MPDNTVNLDHRRQAAVLNDIVAEFAKCGAAGVKLSDLPVPLDRWRKLARKAGRQLQRPVRTKVIDEWILARLEDWPRDDREAAIEWQTKVAAAKAMGDWLTGLTEKPAIPEESKSD